jgi:hypothetical protein
MLAVVMLRSAVVGHGGGPHRSFVVSIGSVRPGRWRWWWWQKVLSFWPPLLSDPRPLSVKSCRSSTSRIYCIHLP